MAGYVEALSAKLLEDEFALDLYLTVALIVLFVACATTCSLLGMDRETQVKRRAWIITTFSGGLCFALSVFACSTEPILWDFRARIALMGETSLSRLVVHFFRVQAALDLVLGVIFYRTELFFLTSVVHHIAYFLLCNWMLSHSCSLLFIICCLEELPTFIMALGRLNKSWRMDLPFGLTYGLLRVGLHTFLCYAVMTYPEKDDRLAVIRFNFGLTWCLHAHWFYGWVLQQHRLRKPGGQYSSAPDSPDTVAKSPSHSSRRSPVHEMINITSSGYKSGGSSRSSTSSRATPKAGEKQP